ncbi:MAG TPA: hypothetical protein VII81_14880, partial [Terriglobales bacterium]
MTATGTAASGATGAKKRRSITVVTLVMAKMKPRIKQVDLAHAGVIVDFDNGSTVLFSPKFLW